MSSRTSLRHLDVFDDDGAWTVEFVPSSELSCGSLARRAQLVGRVRQFVRSEGWWYVPFADGLSIKIPADVTTAGLEERVRALDEVIIKQSHAAFTPKEVEQALNITSRERIRWTKANLLPRSGRRSFKKGSEVFYSCYDAKGIAHLAKHPDIIEGWRTEDLGTGD